MEGKRGRGVREEKERMREVLEDREGHEDLLVRGDIGVAMVGETVFKTLFVQERK